MTTDTTTDLIDPARFTRLAEIDAYAKRRGIDRTEAIANLVNAALSHDLAP